MAPNRDVKGRGYECRQLLHLNELKAFTFNQFPDLYWNNYVMVPWDENGCTPLYNMFFANFFEIIKAVKFS